MKTFFTHWKTSLGAILYAAAHIPQLAAFSQLLQTAGVLLIGGSAQDATTTEPKK